MDELLSNIAKLLNKFGQGEAATSKDIGAEVFYGNDSFIYDGEKFIPKWRELR